MTPKQLRDGPAWLRKAYKEHRRQVSTVLDAEIAHNRKHPKPAPDPRLIQGGGSASGDGAGYAGRYENVVGVSIEDIRRRR